MRLIVELCAEHQMAAIINIHDVALARMFVDRIVGIRQGMIVFDGPSEMLSNEVLSEIYGAEQEVLNSPVSPAVTI
jgi:phosphonate transport system ATP-binding protein